MEPEATADSRLTAETERSGVSTLGFLPDAWELPLSRRRVFHWPSLKISLHGFPRR